MGKKTTWTELLQRFRNRHGDKYDYVEQDYKTQHDKIEIFCKKHNYLFTQRIAHHLNGHGCPICNGGHKRNNLEFIIKSQEVHGDKYDYSKVNYLTKEDSIEIICPMHGSFWQKAHDHTCGCGCPSCAQEIVPWSVRSTTEDFVFKAKEVHKNKYDYSNVSYINNHTPVEIICPKHGSFYQIPRDHLRGDGCSKCILKSQEKIYSWIKETFADENWEWEYSPEWLGLQRFDIYCKRINLAIEYNGEQHYFPVEVFGGEKGFKKCIERDTIKAQLCEENNCTLYIIKYDDVNYDKIREDINNILNSN